jgi:hypothetical protein
VRREREGRGEIIAIGLVCGIPCLLAGLGGTAAFLLNSPGDGLEWLAAGAVGIMGLVFGAGFITYALPERWGLGARLWRWGGWLAPLSVALFGALLLRDPATAAEHSTRIRSSFGAVVTALGMLAFAAWLARSWLTSVRPRRRP